MSETGIIDVREWQEVVSLDTGQRLGGMPAGMDEFAGIGELLRLNPFPGDLAEEGDAWVTDLALQLDRLYSPPLLMLVYAGIGFRATYRGEGSAADAQGIRAEVERFLESSGREYAVLGLGDLVPLRGFTDLSGLEGLPVASGFPGSFAGLFRPSARDLAYLRELPEVRRTVPRDEFRSRFGGCEDFYERFPDWLIELEEGFAPKSFGSVARRPYRIPAKDAEVPLLTDLEPVSRVESITGVEGALRQSLDSGRRVALILVEGLGMRSSPWDARPVSNRMDWFRYGLSESQYLAVASGKHLVHHGYPPCFLYYLLEQGYPYSGIFESLPTDVLGRTAPGMTAAVGNRSIITHACLGADLTIECFARTLYNYGTIAVLRQ